ncbi:MAG: LamG domain-containing protein, partial [Porphyromonadaceae bacterium]|nr:LamG domain-containing protein [Porphyromonadaceae bacterium]
GTDNGSTCHESVIGVRINGDYRYNMDRCIHDINYTRTMNINCITGNVQSGSQTTYGSAGFVTGNSSGDYPSVSLLKNCQSSGNITDLIAGRYATAYIHNCTLPIRYTDVSGSIISDNFTGIKTNNAFIPSYLSRLVWALLPQCQYLGGLQTAANTGSFPGYYNSSAVTMTLQSLPSGYGYTLKSNGLLDLNGSNGGIACANTQIPVSVWQNEFTLLMWLFPRSRNASSNARILSVGQISLLNSLMIRQGSTTDEIRVYINNEAVVGPNIVSVGIVSMIGLHFKGKDIKFWKNGSYISTVSAVTNAISTITNTGGMVIGNASDYSRGFDGYIGGIMQFSGELSSEEHSYLYGIGPNLSTIKIIDGVFKNAYQQHSAENNTKICLGISI